LPHCRKACALKRKRSRSSRPRALLAPLFLACAVASLAGTFVFPEESVSAAYRQDYESAWRLVEDVEPGAEAGPGIAFWRAALTQLLLYDSGRPALADSFYRLSDRAVAACKARLRHEPQDATAHMYLGLTQLNRANCQSWQQQRFRAVFTMLGVERHLRRAVELDSLLEDAWFGIGVIEYFKATADRYVFGMGILGSRERAYDLVERAAGSDGVLCNAALFLQAFMHKEDGEFDRAVGFCEELLERHPGNRAALRMLRDTYLAAGEHGDVIRLGREIEESIGVSFPENRYGLAENRLQMARAWSRSGQQDSARALVDSLVAWEPYRDSVPWLRNYIADARRLKTR